jgi:chaperonin cofactor prefoldin
MFKVEKTALSADLDDRQKTLEMRLASTKKQVDSLTEKLQELQTKIQMELSKQNLRLQ